jgi:hypothetical protein
MKLLRSGYKDSGLYSRRLRLKKYGVPVCAVAAFFFLISGSGCTTIRIVDGDNTTRIETRFGFVAIYLQPDVDSVVTEARCLGIIKSPAGFAIGYSNQEIAALSDSCKVVLWIQNDRQLEQFRELVGDMESVCAVSLQGKEE